MKNRKIEIIVADITTLDVDVIVNAANTQLRAGGGVDGAIHRAAGPQLQQACFDLYECRTGNAKTTPGFNLKARHVIHAVGPVWRGGGTGEPELLKSAYQAALREADKLSAKSIAFPCISTGVYGYPRWSAANIAVATVRALPDVSSLERIVFCCFSTDDEEIYQDAMARQA